MKFAAGIFGILGALGGAFLGAKWLSDLGSAEAQAAEALGELAATDLGGAEGQAAEALGEMAGMAAEMSALKSASYALLACAVLGLVASVMVLRLKGNKAINALLLIVAGALPIVLASKAVFGAPMVLAGLLAFGVKYAPSQQPQA